MAENRQNDNQGKETQDHQSLAENIGTSGSLQDFGGGLGQAAGVQQSAQSQDQFSNDVMQIFDENDFKDEGKPEPPYDYFEDQKGDSSKNES